MMREKRHLNMQAQEHEMEQKVDVVVDSTLPPEQPYVLICKPEDLNKSLDDELKMKLRGLFYD